MNIIASAPGGQVATNGNGHKINENPLPNTEAKAGPNASIGASGAQTKSGELIPKTFDGMGLFLREVMGEWWPNVIGTQVWVAGFPDIENNSGAGWFGYPDLSVLQSMYGDERVRDGGLDLYFCIAPIGPGEKRRSNAGAVAQPLLIVDDIGTKISRPKWDALIAMGCPEPTFRIETSPGNETWGWSADGNAAGNERAQDMALLRAWLVEKELTDEVMDVARYIRLPGGWNSKAKYRAAGEGIECSPLVSLVDWRPPSEFGRVDLDAIGAAVLGRADWRNAGLPTKAGAQAVLTSAQIAGSNRPRTADVLRPEPIMRLAAELGRTLTQVRAGVVECLCPNHAAHTSRVETGFAFLGDGLMHCNHGHCQGLSTSDFRDMLCQEYDEQAGVEGAGSHFLAVETFRDLGAFDDLAAVQAQADDMAARQAIASAARQEANGDGKTTKQPLQSRALDLLIQNQMQPFLDPKGTGVWMWISDCLFNIKSKTGSRKLRGWLSQRGIDLSGTAWANLTDTLEARAAAQPDREVSFRIGAGGTPNAPEVYVNLMDEAGRGVRVTGQGWSVVPVADLPVNLAHREGGLALHVPVRARDGLSFFDRLSPHVRLEPIGSLGNSRDEGVKQRGVLLTWFVSQFGNGAAPHLLSAGEQGSGKTTGARRLNGLTDPDAGAVLSRLPGDGAQVISQVAQQRNIILDNTSGLREDMADVLCVLSTGGAHVTRRLYTDNERSVTSAVCSVIFTSVLDSGITRRPDLLDRMLPLSMRPLSGRDRKSESELNAAWETDLPFLLADLFDLLAVGLKHVQKVRDAQRMGLLPPPPRFADAAQVAEAAAWHGLGWPPGLLTRTLNNLREDAANDQLAEDPIAVRLRTFLQSQPNSVWSGSYTDLQRALQCLEGPAWPARLSVRNGLPRITAPLRTLWGIETTDAGRTKHARIKRFQLLPGSPREGVGATEDNENSPEN